MNIFINFLQGLIAVSAAVQFLETFNRFFDGVTISEAEFREKTESGYIVMEDRQLYQDQSTQDKWYSLMQAGTVQQVVEQHYPGSQLIFVEDLETFLSENKELYMKKGRLGDGYVAKKD